jgi:20S proteasome alpha/beta subunit
VPGLSEGGGKVTVVVGVQHKTGVILAADAQWSWDNDNRMADLAQPKVHSLLETLAVGYCGSGRFGQILTYHLVDSLEDPFLPREGRDEQYWAVREFIPYLRDVTHQHGHLHILEEDQTESFGQSAFLLAVRGELFLVESDFSVNQHRLPYESVGSGAENAMGVLHELLGEDPNQALVTEARAEKIARKAVQAAITFNNYVGGDISVVRTTLYTDEEKDTAKQILGKRR